MDIAWLRKAALQGHARAQNRLAEIYERGTGVPKSYKESLKWYRRAASQGDDLAQFNLARLLEASGASKESLLWFHKAGELGNLLAQVELGNRYQTDVDDDQAFKWFRMAAEQGHSSAQYHLGLMYRNGRGILCRLSRSHPLASPFCRARPFARHRCSAKTGTLLKSINSLITSISVRFPPLSNDSILRAIFCVILYIVIYIFQYKDRGIYGSI